MSKSFWGVIVAVIIVFVGIFALTGNNSKSGSSGSTSSKTLSEHTIGSKSSGVTLVEYGDYQCPYCEQYFATVKQVQDQYKDKVLFQFRNFPLVNAHKNAFAAARAAEAAGLGGKFWEMHDSLYAQQNWQVWTEASDPTTFFADYAKQIGLDVNKFKTDFASSRVNDLVNADMAEGNRLGVQGTPSFFINGKQTQISNTVASFQKVLDEAIAKQAKDSSASQ